MKLGIIGGSGFYRIGDGEKKRLKTPFGISGSIVQLKDAKNESELFFLARHGQGHTVPPHLINYRANIYALKTLGVEAIFATNATGSCRDNLKPGSFVVPDQILDFTSGREHTFFLGSGAEDGVPTEFKKVQHTDVTNPFSQTVRVSIMSALKNLKIPYFDKATLSVFNGPRFETAAEVQMSKLLGGDLMGMTSAPEAFLARELGIDYATTAVVTNYGAGMQDKVTHEEVVEIFDEKFPMLKDIIFSAITTYSSSS